MTVFHRCLSGFFPDSLRTISDRSVDQWAPPVAAGSVQAHQSSLTDEEAYDPGHSTLCSIVNSAAGEFFCFLAKTRIGATADEGFHSSQALFVAFDSPMVYFPSKQLRRYKIVLLR
mmetsp:Transcript_6986/g.10855  ORF Transcript_6986/g.10855 Transcript_6986/m.10855 type:complete len:116 (+) Transcript_6986:752-1099(+)